MYPYGYCPCRLIREWKPTATVREHAPSCPVARATADTAPLVRLSARLRASLQRAARVVSS